MGTDDTLHTPDRAEDLFASRTIVEEGRPQDGLTPRKLYAYLTDPAANLTAQEQAQLRAELRWFRDYRRMEQLLRSPGSRVVPRAAAASVEGGLAERAFDGGKIRIVGSVREGRIFVSIKLSSVADPPQMLILERGNELAKTALPAPESDGTIMVMKFLASKEDADFVALLRDPSTTGVFR